MNEASTSVGLPDLTNPNRKHDRVLKVGSKKFYVNKKYVSSWSQYLDLLLNGDFVEQNQTEIEIKDVDTDLFEIFLRTIYPGAPNLTFPECLQLLDLERFLSSEALVLLCSRRILALYKNSEIEIMETLETAAEFKLHSIMPHLLDSTDHQEKLKILAALEQLSPSNPEMAEQLHKLRETPAVVGIMCDAEYERYYRD